MGLFKKFHAVKYQGKNERGVQRFHSKADADRFEREMKAKGARTEMTYGEHD